MRIQHEGFISLGHGGAVMESLAAGRYATAIHREQQALYYTLLDRETREYWESV